MKRIPLGRWRRYPCSPLTAVWARSGAPPPPASVLTVDWVVWRPTTRGECVGTIKAAVDPGITVINLTPRYGDGKAAQVVGEAIRRAAAVRGE
jgi:aryl-alcohol dehydrogenase-like predicted oxidoreductase